LILGKKVQGANTYAIYMSGILLVKEHSWVRVLQVEVDTDTNTNTDTNTDTNTNINTDSGNDVIGLMVTCVVCLQQHEQTGQCGCAYETKVCVCRVVTICVCIYVC
jgi:hypothetical protein